MPSVVVVACCQPIYQDRHGIDFGYMPIIIPWNPSFRFNCHAFEKLLVMLEAALVTSQWSSPLTLSKFHQSVLASVSCCRMQDSQISASSHQI